MELSEQGEDGSVVNLKSQNVLARSASVCLSDLISYVMLTSPLECVIGRSEG